MPYSRQCDFDVSAVAQLPAPTTLAADLFEPETTTDTVLVCYPGGGNNRRYFDLTVPGDSSHSFARAMLARGWAVLTVDHLGIGDSTRPDNGYDVTIERIIATHHEVVQQLRRQYPQWRRVVIVGHSMGAMLGIFQQDRFHSFDAMALLGFGLAGLPDALNAEARLIAQNPRQALEQATEIARLTFNGGYFQLPPKDDKARGRGDEALGAACAAAVAPILSIASAMSLVPEIARQEIAGIDVPVLVANGDRDLAGATEQFGDAFVRGTAVDRVPLVDCGHNHFQYTARFMLFDAIDDWLRRTPSR